MPTAHFAIQSMTGFATRRSRWNEWEASWEIKSVNNRFLDATVRLPDWLRTIETEARSLIMAKIRRGRVDATVTLRRITDANPGFSVNQPVMRALCETLAEIHANDALPLGSPTSLEILKWPGVLIESEMDRDALGRQLLVLLDETLLELIKTRKAEGEAIAALIDQRCDLIAEEVKKTQTRLPTVMHLLKERLTLKVQELVQDPEKDRMEQEILYYAQRLDVAEELERLIVHLQEMKRSLQSQEPVGRRLDFLTQELNREANTLGSKSQDAEMTRSSVEIKVLIEQMKEQIQNVE